MKAVINYTDAYPFAVMIHTKSIETRIGGATEAASIKHACKWKIKLNNQHGYGLRRR